MRKVQACVGLSFILALWPLGSALSAAEAAEAAGAQWTYCAPEGGTCSFSGVQEVRYGAQGRFRNKVLIDGTKCTNSVFGDPIPGAAKSCWYRDWSNAAVRCDNSRGTCASPQKLSKWDWQLSSPYDFSSAGTIPWYDLDWEDTSAGTVQALHAKGANVACYISVGTWENYRGDRGLFPKVVKGKIYGDWPDERWLDLRRTDILIPIMEARMQTCKKKGFDGVQFDNLDGFEGNALAKTGFPLERIHALRYARWLANIAHSKGLSTAWENAVPLVPGLVAYMDWFIMEECNQYNECGIATHFTDIGKFVGAVEYSDSMGLNEFKTYCSGNTALGISSIFKRRDLDGRLLWSCQ